jgi:hypothetical protein
MKRSKFTFPHHFFENQLLPFNLESNLIVEHGLLNWASTALWERVYLSLEAVIVATNAFDILQLIAFKNNLKQGFQCCWKQAHTSFIFSKLSGTINLSNFFEIG